MLKRYILVFQSLKIISFELIQTIRNLNISYYFLLNSIQNELTPTALLNCGLIRNEIHKNKINTYHDQGYMGFQKFTFKAIGRGGVK